MQHIRGDFKIKKLIRVPSYIAKIAHTLKTNSLVLNSINRVIVLIFLLSMGCTNVENICCSHKLARKYDIYSLYVP